MDWWPKCLLPGTVLSDYVEHSHAAGAPAGGGQTAQTGLVQEMSEGTTRFR